MGNKSRDSDGTFSGRATDQDVLEAVEEHDPAKTTEIAEAIGYSQDGAYDRLQSLHKEGRVAKKKIAESVVWYPISRD